MNPSNGLTRDAAMLQEAVEDAEDVCRAIARGEVDAFVVGDENNRKVLLLANAYQRYRQLVERMPHGAVTVSEQGNILYANQKFSQMLGIPLAQLYTAPLDAYASIGDRARLGSYLMVGSAGSQIELTLTRRDGTPLPVKLTVVSSADGYATLLVTDLRPLHWPALTVESLESIRDSLEQVNRAAPADQAVRNALDRISDEVNGLARMIDEMLDVEGPQA
jgi:PAS domain S-box-containing protein